MVLIVMGVVGAGKTTVGLLLAKKLGWRFADADDFHSDANKEKIRHGIPLDDKDRAPWLDALRDAIEQWNSAGENVVLACSALKNSYRERLRAGAVQFVFLKGSYQLILERLHLRHGHFANESILESQLKDLEEPNDAITVSIDRSPDAVASEVISQIKLDRFYPGATK